MDGNEFESLQRASKVIVTRIVIICVFCRAYLWHSQCAVEFAGHWPAIKFVIFVVEKIVLQTWLFFCY